jgi:hypothetical protein
MLSLADSKRILGSAAQNLSDEEILSIRDSLRELAEIALETKAENIQRHLVPALPKQEGEW